MELINLIIAMPTCSSCHNLVVSVSPFSFINLKNYMNNSISFTIQNSSLINFQFLNSNPIWSLIQTECDNISINFNKVLIANSYFFGYLITTKTKATEVDLSIKDFVFYSSTISVNINFFSFLNNIIRGYLLKFSLTLLMLP